MKETTRTAAAAPPCIGVPRVATATAARDDQVVDFKVLETERVAAARQSDAGGIVAGQIENDRVRTEREGGGREDGRDREEEFQGFHDGSSSGCLRAGIHGDVATKGD